MEKPVIIDPELSRTIPPLTDEEYQQLEANILADGCREPLVVWSRITVPDACEDVLEAYESKTNIYCKYCDKKCRVIFGDGILECSFCGAGLAPWDSEDVLLDGHNRYKICNQHGIKYELIEYEFDSHEEAADWIDANQLGRRNLSPEQMSLLRGRRYNRTKAQGTRSDLTSPQNEEKLTTAEKLADQYGVSRATIERDGAFATAVDELREIQPDIEQRIARGSDAPTKTAVLNAAQLLEQGHEEAALAELDRKANAPVLIVDRIGVFTDVFYKFSRMIGKVRGALSVQEMFEGFGPQQAEWIIQEAGSIGDEMQTWRQEMLRRFPELRRRGLHQVNKSGG
jgi:glutaredoxin